MYICRVYLLTYLLTYYGNNVAGYTFRDFFHLSIYLSSPTRRATWSWSRCCCHRPRLGPRRKPTSRGSSSSLARPSGHPLPSRLQREHRWRQPAVASSHRPWSLGAKPRRAARRLVSSRAWPPADLDRRRRCKAHRASGDARSRCALSSRRATGSHTILRSTGGATRGSSARPSAPPAASPRWRRPRRPSRLDRSARGRASSRSPSSPPQSSLRSSCWARCWGHARLGRDRRRLQPSHRAPWRPVTWAAAAWAAATRRAVPQ